MKRHLIRVLIGALLLGPGLTAPAAAGELTPQAFQPFGEFGGIGFTRYTGRFSGATSLGAFDVPFAIIAPTDVSQSNGTVLFEPPHFAFGPLARDAVLTPNLLFSQGFGYATVGWGANGLNVLDPTAAPIVIAGATVATPGAIDPTAVLDDQIIVQFVGALNADPSAVAIFGGGVAVYAAGVSQTSAALVNLFLGPDGAGLFDFSLLVLALWEPATFPLEFSRLNGLFVPPPNVGKVTFVQSEGDLLISAAEEYRRAADAPNYRVYEVAGTPHQPLNPPFNPLDWSPVARAAFVAGDRWIVDDLAPPPNALLAEAPAGEVDPIHAPEVTGIARDSDGNALGGVRLPEVEVGQALYIASLLDFEIAPGLPGLVGAIIDLQCAPLGDGSVRFANHGGYMNRYVDQARALRKERFLLASDAEALIERAAGSGTGKPDACP
jgi:hypothetical protein